MRLQELHTREKAAQAVTVTKREVQRFLDVAERTKAVDAFHGNYLECVVAAQVQKRVEGVSELFESLIKSYPCSLAGHREYWRFLKNVGNVRGMLSVAREMETAGEDYEVPTDLWVDAHIVSAKTHVMNGDLERALDALRKVCSIMPPIRESEKELTGLARVVEKDSNATEP